MRELNPKQAFQVHCLAQMGVSSWLSVSDGGVTGAIYMSPQPWSIHSLSDADLATAVEPPNALTIAPEGFAASAPEPARKALPEEKQKSVAGLREQLNSGPEIIVEDLQPIEELAVDIEVESEELVSSQITRLDVRAYVLSNKLLILSDVPQVFSQETEVEQLALKMGAALLKQPIDEWQGSALSWPGGLKNPQFLTRGDWLLGALESFVMRLVKGFPDRPMLVLAGANVSQLMEDLPENNPLKQYKTAKIASLSELYRIPELRKDAWEAMQSGLFAADA